MSIPIQYQYHDFFRFQYQYQYQYLWDSFCNTETNTNTSYTLLSIPIPIRYRKYRKFSISIPKLRRYRLVSHSTAWDLPGPALALHSVSQTTLVTKKNKGELVTIPGPGQPDCCLQMRKRWLSLPRKFHRSTQNRLYQLRGGHLLHARSDH